MFSRCFLPPFSTQNLDTCTDSEDKQVNTYFDKVATSYPPPLVLNVEAKSNTLRFLELVITTDGDRLSCRVWNSVARNTGSGESLGTLSLLDSRCWKETLTRYDDCPGLLVPSTGSSRDALQMMTL